jgi:catecholate siderophore receptor
MAGIRPFFVGSVLAGLALPIAAQTAPDIPPARYAITVTEGPRYTEPSSATATKTLTPLLDVPQSITVVTQQLIRDQTMLSVGDVVRYVPGVTAIQGENNRDQVVIRGNSTSADFFVDGVRDDVQYYRDLYNLDRVEILKGPNAMIFGRGGGGGLINRVTKEAEFVPLREITLTGGAYGDKRFATDLNQALNDKVAVRLNGLFENSDSFRNDVGMTRYGINPTLTLKPTKTTRITLSYERFRDDRTADRGIPSFQGQPVDVPISTFFGNPDVSHVRAAANLGSINLEQQAGRMIIHTRTTFGAYDRGYQNFVPGAVSADRTEDTLTAYNNATKRFNFFNQTDATYTAYTGKIKHTLLTGIEVGSQLTDNFRNTGFFNNTSTSILIPLSSPTIATPTTFRQSATDADNHVHTAIAAGYIQDQIELSGISK